MIPTHSTSPRARLVPERRTRLERSALPLVATAVLVLALLPSAVTRAGELDSTEAIESLCALSEPRPAAESAAAAVMLAPLRAAPALTSSTRSAARRVYAGQRAEALLDTWHVDVSAGQVLIAEHDALLDELVIGAWEPLVIDSTSGHAISLDQPLVALRCGAGRAADALLAHAAGLVRLELEVQLTSAERPAEPFCRAREDARLVLDGQLLRARLVHTGSGGVVLCETTTPRAIEREVRFATSESGDEPPWRAQVEVARVDLIGPGGRSSSGGEASGVEALRNEVESALMPCYQQTLCRSGQRQGALTFRATVRSAALRDAAITVDALDSEAIASCALRQLEEVELDRRFPASDVGLVVIFRVGGPDDDHPTARLVESLGRAVRGATLGSRGTLSR